MARRWSEVQRTLSRVRSWRDRLGFTALAFASLSLTCAAEWVIKADAPEGPGSLPAAAGAVCLALALAPFGGWFALLFWAYDLENDLEEAE